MPEEEFADDRQHRPLLLSRQHFADQARQAARERLEHRIDFGRRQTRAEFIDEGIVGRQVARLAQQLRLVTHQVYDLFEVRSEVLELAGLACLQPLGLGLGGGLCQSRYQRNRGRDGEISLAAHLAHVRDLPVFESVGIRLGPVEQPRDARRRDQRVVFGFERGELLATNVRAAARHHHRRIPAQDRHGATEGVQAFPFLLELFVRGLGHGTTRGREK